MVKSWNTSTLCFCSLPILSFFLKIYPSEGHITTRRYFFASEWKNRVKTSKSSNILQLLYPYICLIFRNSFRYLNFRPQLSDGDMYNHWYMSPHLARVRSFNKGHITTRSLQNILCFCSLPVLSFSKFIRWLYVPSEWNNHVQIFFVKTEWKNRVKTSKFSHSLQLLYPYICLMFLNSLRYLNFRPELSDGDMYNHRYISPRG